MVGWAEAMNVVTWFTTTQKRLFWFMLLAEVKLLIIVVLDPRMNITHGAQCNCRFPTHNN